MSQTSLPGITPSPTKTPFPTPIYIPRPTETPAAILAPTTIPTPDPSGTYSLVHYKPLILVYDPTIWDRSGGLQNRALKTCHIDEIGPVDFNQAPPAETVNLGKITYTVIPFLDYPSDKVYAYFIDDRSLPEYNYETALPLLSVQAGAAEWAGCKLEAEKVLSTLALTALPLPSGTPSPTPSTAETLQLTQVTVPWSTLVALPTLMVRGVQVTSAEEDMRYLVGQWLEGFKTVRTTDLIRDYRIDQVTVGPLLPEDHDYCIIARVQFSIEPVAVPPSNNWASIGIGEEGPWWRLSMTFGATCLRNVLKLQLLPGWGT